MKEDSKGGKSRIGHIVFPHLPASPASPLKGRGAASNLQGRYEADIRERFDDGWPADGEAVDAPPIKTEVVSDNARSILTRNASPDIPFSVSLNPYRGCEHVMRYESVH